MKSNETLQKDVQDAIKWEPLLKVEEIGVIAKEGIITLTGIVDCYIKKLEAEEAARNVEGVKAVVEKIEIRFKGAGQMPNAEMANQVLSALKSNVEVPDNKVRVKVEEGWVTLEGNLAWNYQKESAKKSANNIIGIRGITNNIEIISEHKNGIDRTEVETALARNWAITNQDIQVKVSGNKVILTGIVNSAYQKDEAAKIAWKAPGVWNVENNLIVETKYTFSGKHENHSSTL